jgi:hypothetical protein
VAVLTDERLAEIEAGCAKGYPLSFDVTLALVAEVRRSRAATVDRARLDAKVTLVAEGLDGPARTALASAVERTATTWTKAYVRVERDRRE